MNNLLLLRKEKGLTQKDVADHLGISRQAYANYECGNREPDIGTLKMLSEYFGVSIDFILSNSEYLKEEKPTATTDGEPVEEDVVIFHRDGKTQKKKLSKDQLAMLMAMVDALPESDDED